MATMFEPSLSTSIRAPLSSATPPSMADSLPSINFGFEELRETMAKFTVRFDDFIERGRKRVLEERNQFRINVAELHEDRRMKERSIEILTTRASAHEQTLQKESLETSEMHSAIASLSTTRDDVAAQRDRLLSQIAETNKLIASRVEAQRAHAQQLDRQERFNAPELSFWEEFLGLRIEGVGEDDKLKFVFTGIGRGNGKEELTGEDECWFVLDCAKREYEVLRTEPRLEKDMIDGAVDSLNEKRELGGFLKMMRGLFAEALK